MALSDEVKADYQRYQETQVVLGEIELELKEFNSWTKPIIEEIKNRKALIELRHSEAKYKVGEAYKTYKQGYDLEMADSQSRKD